jgi:hypothetical protein
VADSTTSPVAGIILNTANSAASNIEFYTSASNNAGMGTEQMRITSTGNLGIGTTNPGQVLSLNTPSATNALIQLGINNSIYGYYGIAAASGNTIAGSVFGDTVIRSQGGNILLSTDGGNTANVYLKNGGNVGIGTTSPQS